MLNAERVRCGFSQLAQSTWIDTAADSHSVWMLRNGIQVHDQIAGTVGFTGRSLEERLRVAGYTSARVAGEVTSPIDDWTRNGEAGVRLLFSAARLANSVKASVKPARSSIGWPKERVQASPPCHFWLEGHPTSAPLSQLGSIRAPLQLDLDKRRVVL